MPDQLGGYTFICDLRDSLMREVCFTGIYEPQETLLAQSLLRKGMTVVDVGANWGYFTLLAAHLVGDRGRVLGLEPDPRMFRILQQNVQRNGLPHVKILPVAATDRKATTTLSGYNEQDGNFGLSRLSQSGGDRGACFQVSGMTLDDVLDAQSIRCIDLMKMDVEGGEAAALAGLTRTLSSGRVRWLLLEVHPAQLAEKGRSAGEVVAELQQYGYRGWRIDHGLSATRQAAYNRTGPTLHPLASSGTLGPWPHLFWERVQQSAHENLTHEQELQHTSIATTAAPA
jgi:FkbM family methyltransferase